MRPRSAVPAQLATRSCDVIGDIARHVTGPATIAILASLLPIAACTPSATHPHPAAATGYVLPAELSTNRWFLNAKTAVGVPLRIYLDSAGGMYLKRDAVMRLGLVVETEPTEGDNKFEVVPFPGLADPRIPLPKLPRIPVMAGQAIGDSDGMFGAPWFSGHAFSFDYPARTLTLLDHGTPEVPPEHRLAVGFPRNDAGKVASPYGRIQMIVGGETLDMLLDTGADATLTDSAREALGGGPVERATSFITKTVFNRWRAKHPDWHVIEHADQLPDKNEDAAPMIDCARSWSVATRLVRCGSRAVPTRRSTNGWRSGWTSRPKVHSAATRIEQKFFEKCCRQASKQQIGHLRAWAIHKSLHLLSRTIYAQVPE